MILTVTITGGTLSPQEIEAYVNRAREMWSGQPLSGIDLDVDGDFISITYHVKPVPFERVRRITGYLVGNLSRFNNAKKAEVADRVTHA